MSPFSTRGGNTNPYILNILQIPKNLFFTTYFNNYMDL